MPRRGGLLTVSLGDSIRIAGSLNSMLDPGLQERAFGRPGEAGDAGTLNHLAQHICSLLAQWLDSAIGVRSIVVPSRLDKLRILTIQLSDKAIRDAYSFIKETISELGGLPQRLASHPAGEPLFINRTLKLTVDSSVQSQHRRELRKLGHPKA